jgi:hypothetical protein
MARNFDILRKRMHIVSRPTERPAPSRDRTPTVTYSTGVPHHTHLYGELVVVRDFLANLNVPLGIYGNARLSFHGDYPGGAVRLRGQLQITKVHSVRVNVNQEATCTCRRKPRSCGIRHCSS